MKDLSFETNLYAQLIGGQYEIEAKLKTKQKYLKTAEENKKTAEENKNSGL
jgi:hypothetical protein